MIPDRNAARELLAFYLEAGVDTTMGDTPHDRLGGPAESPSLAASSLALPGPPETGTQTAERPARPGALGRPTQSRPSRTVAPASTDELEAPPSPEAATMAAREMARSAGSLAELRALLEGFNGCALKATATRLVFADGNPQARVMFVGEAPGRDEDIEGLPFVGRSGKLLDRMMAAIGLDRSGTYIANVIPWRPPGNRTPTPQETQICLPFTLRQIELADPDVLVCLGGPAAHALLSIKEGILKTRGRWFSFHTGRREIRAIATLHPAYLLRQPVQKRLAWRDFLAIRKALAG
jgi:DNA polymerase